MPGTSSQDLWELIVHFSFQLCIQWHQICRLKLTVVTIFTPQKLTNYKSRLLFLENQLLIICQHTTAYLIDTETKGNNVFISCLHSAWHKISAQKLITINMIHIFIWWNWCSEQSHDLPLATELIRGRDWFCLVPQPSQLVWTASRTETQW